MGKLEAHFSEKTLDAAEKAQHMLGRLGAPIVRAVTGSSSPAYLQLQWLKQPQLNPDDYTWLEVDGDPSAGPIPRLWPKAAVFGTAWEKWVEARHAVPSFDRKNSKEAIAFVADNVVRVGTRDDYYGLFHEVRGEGGSMAAVAMRLGRGPLKATVGQWSPKEQRLFVPDELSLLAGTVQIDQMADRYPGVPLV